MYRHIALSCLLLSLHHALHKVNNNCSTGSTALFLAKQLIEGGRLCLLIAMLIMLNTAPGISDCILALGFEKMERGSLGVKVSQTTSTCIIPSQHTMTTHSYAITSHLALVTSP